MRRLATGVAALALAVSGLAGMQQASANPGICVAGFCLCVTGGQCTSPLPSGGNCVDVDLDDDGDAETVCVPPITH